jgi:hypothetical protein
MLPVIILLVIAAIALAGGVGSWVVFAFMIWVGLWLLFGGRRRYRGRMRQQRRAARRWAREQWAAAMQEQEQPLPPPPPQQAIAPPPVPAVNLSQLPADVEKKADRIRRKAAVLGQHSDRFPIGSRDLYVVQHTATDYLPATVKAYVEVPPWSVETPTADGRTPLQIMHSQLDILEAKLDEIAEGVRKQRVDNLLANERFLEENFGSNEAELTIPH